MYKDFDIEKAKQGLPVVYFINGMYLPVRIICFDRITNYDSAPVIGLTLNNGAELMVYSNALGEDPNGNKKILFMAPVKRQEWVNIYKAHERTRCSESSYPSEAEAKAGIDPGRTQYISTVLIHEWEE